MILQKSTEFVNPLDKIMMDIGSNSGVDDDDDDDTNSGVVLIGSNSGVFMLCQLSLLQYRMFQLMYFKNYWNEIKIKPQIVNDSVDSLFNPYAISFGTVISEIKSKQYHLYALMHKNMVIFKIDYSKGKFCSELIEIKNLNQPIINGCDIVAISQNRNELNAFALDKDNNNMYHAVYRENKFVTISILKYSDFAYGLNNVIAFRFVPNNLANILSLLAIPDESYTNHIGMKLFMHSDDDDQGNWISKLLNKIPQKLSDTGNCCQIKGNKTNILIYFDTYYRYGGNVLIYDINANKFVFTNISFQSEATNTIQITIIKRDKQLEQLLIDGWCRNHIEKRHNINWPRMLTQIILLFHDEEYVHIINDNPYNSKYYMHHWTILVDKFFAYLYCD